MKKYTIGETVISDDEHDEQMAPDEPNRQIDSEDGAITESNLPEAHPGNGAIVESQQLLNSDPKDSATVASTQLTTPECVVVDNRRTLRSRARDGAGAASRPENRLPDFVDEHPRGPNYKASDYENNDNNTAPNVGAGRDNLVDAQPEPAGRPVRARRHPACMKNMLLSVLCVAFVGAADDPESESGKQLFLAEGAVFHPKGELALGDSEWIVVYDVSRDPREKYETFVAQRSDGWSSFEKSRSLWQARGQLALNVD